MRATLQTLLLPSVLLTSVFVACSGGGDGTPGGGGHGGSGSSSSGGGAGGSPPMPAPFGLDARPANPTCLAPARPPSTPVPVQFVPVFAGLKFNAPMGITQIPGDPSRFFVFQRG